MIIWGSITSIGETNRGALRFTGTIGNGTAIVKTGAGTWEPGGTNIAN